MPRKGETTRVWVDAICGNCQTSFRLSEAAMKSRLANSQSGKLYCSSSCSVIGRCVWVDVPCANCGTTFKLTDKHRAARLAASQCGKLYCSCKCRAADFYPKSESGAIQKATRNFGWRLKCCECKCKCGVTFWLLPSTMEKRLRVSSDLYCSRLCAVNYSNGIWATFIHSPEEKAELALWEKRLIEEGLGMNRGLSYKVGQHPMFKDESGVEVEAWTTEPERQRQFSYSS